VENAIRHGVSARQSGGTVRVRIERNGEELVLAVEDDGPGFKPGPGAPHGLGLANTRARLEQLYGTKAALATENLAAGGACVSVRLPLRTSPVTPARGVPVS
jgi:sensor histidine kinase YesM